MMEKDPMFKKKSQEKQFQFNATVMDKREEAIAGLQQTPPAVEKAKTRGRYMTSLKTRQKHIRIADRSEYGWAAVEEYVKDELADGEERRESREQSLGLGKSLSLSRELKIRKGLAFSLARNPSMLMPRLEEGLPLMGCRDPLVASKQADRSLQQLAPCFMRVKHGHLRKSCPLLLGKQMNILIFTNYCL